jgi:hypothetical protein
MFSKRSDNLKELVICFPFANMFFKQITPLPFVNRVILINANECLIDCMQLMLEKFPHIQILDIRQRRITPSPQRLSDLLFWRECESLRELHIDLIVDINQLDHIAYRLLQRKNPALDALSIAPRVTSHKPLFLLELIRRARHLGYVGREDFIRDMIHLESLDISLLSDNLHLEFPCTQRLRVRLWGSAQIYDILRTGKVRQLTAVYSTRGPCSMVPVMILVERRRTDLSYLPPDFTALFQKADRFNCKLVFEFSDYKIFDLISQWDFVIIDAEYTSFFSYYQGARVDEQIPWVQRLYVYLVERISDIFK